MLSILRPFSLHASSSLRILATLLSVSAAAALVAACGGEGGSETGGSGGAGSTSTGEGGLGGIFGASASSGPGGSMVQCDPVVPNGGEPNFAKAYGDAASQSAVAVNVDKSGNILIAGSFQGSMILGPVTLTSAGKEDVFIAKLTPSGEVMWAKSFGDANNQFAQGIAADASGNVIVAGIFIGNINFGGGTLTSNTIFFQDVFLAKFGPDGTHIFSNRFGGTNSENVNALAVDAGGNAILAGDFQLSVDFGGGTLTSEGPSDAYVAKYGPNGAFLWAKQFGDAAEQKARAVAIDDKGNILVGGQAAGAIDLGGGPLSAPGNPSAFAAKLDAEGGHVWSKVWGSGGKASISAIAAGPNDHVAIAGAFTGSLDLGGGKWENPGVDDGFVAVIGPLPGVHSWSKRFGDEGSQGANAVVMTPAREVLLAGVHTGAIDLGTGPIVSKEGFDGFLGKFDESGCPIWVRAYGGALGQSPKALVSNPISGGSLLTGTFSGTVDFGAGPLPSNGDDVFLLAIKP
ncbi:hypothetical protein [Polyangium aurulentum]|uniref:hypothetical protein n=1 Tax=Polyangium aurulentum TaxID=2567896 RepID=UPI0010AEC70B|nr:hypothetical protein [Polyangium aurulentum]UQA55125.1 hypothetical protein E8A73_027675 [Polyangium aurulentum]